MPTCVLRPWLVPAAFALLCGCGTESPPQPTETFSGVVEIGEPIANATVFIDDNNDNIYDGNDGGKVTTDATGHYTLTWSNFGAIYGVPHSIVAIVLPTSTRVGVTGTNAVGFEVHLRAPVGDFVPAESDVITPLSTLVVSEMAYDPTLSKADAAAKVATALSASTLPFSGQPLDVMADYTADVTTSSNSAQLRYAAGAVAGVLSTAVADVNAAQSTIDCNKADYFDAIAVAVDQQLTAIANGTSKFAQLAAAQQADVAANPGNYLGYFIDTSALAAAIKAELEARAIAFAQEIVNYLKDQFIKQFEEDVIRLVAGELIAFALGG